MMWDRFYRLNPGVQAYPWGARRHGDELPYIAQLLSRAPDDDQPYAELWVGAHPALPCTFSVAGREWKLNDAIAEFPEEILGSRLVDAGLRSLPLLLKILDCEAPLSIQAHPNRALARTLHQRHPDHYPDANHKPEVAIALTPFKALCRFRERAQIQGDLSRHAALSTLFSEQLDDVAEPRWLRRAYRRLFGADSTEIGNALKTLTDTLAASQSPSPEDRCFSDLARHYPGDRGALCAYFLNTVELAPGEAIFLAPDEPHAYLHGTIIECMANSNNVVRAGLTPKFMDVPVLLEMLTYEEGLPRIWRGGALPGGGRCFEVPVPDFAVELWEGDAGDEFSPASDGTVSLLLVLDGTASLRAPGQEPVSATRGSCWLWPGALADCRVAMQTEHVRVVRARPGT
ncbi:MAG: mannose-6-phosphate isomerase, class I [Lentisphaerae bacterium]|nr:mannose-6-phosphate isomerase, class I [Lentisphaerota bacterium]MBT4820814.1 mannose-6-phosphate isomerase, class I [Lentisphaerota bacterium]MBT5605512.1 mannose-6-phosphate isomerase, class I [Lentisphaerota bacterium]MBT7060057.1 mannose-6-phosphate isomerase, class I [Lentisphaerota bacterium]MBT7840883.1 mannose-6-phosphate isomerase, class I [Lentisphaerota bacterium]